jgi:glycosyltransferase involved in cell wall biosynthesis
MEKHMKQVKVVHVTTIALSLQSLLLNQMKSIQSKGYEVVGISSPGEEVHLLEASGIRHVAIHMSRKVTPLLDLVSLVRLYLVMRQEGFTIVHTHTPKAGLLGQLAARFAGVPIVVNTVHGLYVHDRMHPILRRIYISLEKVAARCSDVILSQNYEDVETASSLGICPLEKIKHLGNGIDLAIFNRDQVKTGDIRRKRKQLGIPDDTKVVGFVGRLAGKRKGFNDFLMASHRVAEQCPNVRFLIIGEADVGEADAVDPSTAKDHGAPDRCLFLGGRPNAELPSLFAVMDMLVLPSLFEGVPRVVMEAAAMGVPAVVTNVKGNREAVVHGRNGLLVPLGDPQALADAIIDLLKNPEKAKCMGEEAYRMARERFDERVVFAKVINEYSRLLVEKDLRVPESDSKATEPAHASSNGRPFYARRLSLLSREDRPR